MSNRCLFAFPLTSAERYIKIRTINKMRQRLCTLIKTTTSNGTKIPVKYFNGQGETLLKAATTEMVLSILRIYMKI